MAATYLNSDKPALLQVLKHIEFTRNMMSEAEVIHSAEELLTQFSEFQVTFNKYNKSWDYYIRCRTQYPNSRTPDSTNKLEALTISIETLIEKGV